MSNTGFVPKPLSAPELRKLVLVALEKAPDERNPETFHALFDHLERGLSTDDVIHALEGKWTIARSKFNRDEWQYKYEIDGFSIDEEPITIIIAVDGAERVHGGHPMEERMTPNSVEQRAEHLATLKKPFHFVDSGLPNIYLAGIRYFTYPDGRIVAEIPSIKPLMQLIARDLIQKQQSLTGDEIRFLRKRLGQKQTDFARAIGIEPETLSRCENGRQKLGESNDKFIRFYYAFAALGDAELHDLRQGLVRMAALWHDMGHAPFTRDVVAKIVNEQWELQAA